MTVLVLRVAASGVYAWSEEGKASGRKSEDEVRIYDCANR